METKHGDVYIKGKPVPAAIQASSGAGPINSCCNQGILNYSEQITLSMCRGTPKPRFDNARTAAATNYRVQELKIIMDKSSSSAR